MPATSGVENSTAPFGHAIEIPPFSLVRVLDAPVWAGGEGVDEVFTRRVHVDPASVVAVCPGAPVGRERANGNDPVVRGGERRGTCLVVSGGR